jgi:hypothetical protein
MQVTTIGLDIAKNVLQVHGIDAAEKCGGRLIHERRKPMMKIIAAAAFLAAPWQPAHAQAIVGSIIASRLWQNCLARPSGWSSGISC